MGHMVNSVVVPTAAVYNNTPRICDQSLLRSISARTRGQWPLRRAGNNGNVLRSPFLSQI